MSNTLTVRLNKQTESRLRQLASEEGASLEAVVERLLDDISIELETDNDAASNHLSDEQLADLRERLRNPGPIASPERVAAVLAKFRV
jgi:predicted transcriptional regulator